ncbi:MAG: YfcE family phosphodiesterase [Candidatus Lokiarchaeota archaeon]|nr:YfcE family phosphodiesterase [Candidatus Lokiarchaeota archaeon]MBD3341028.1 YfcE family phosphodiesterase [Candidatus Lokiarchaeota archaeon]
MDLRIVVIGDTHVLNFGHLPRQFIQEIKNSDYIFHTGDYTSINVLEGLKNLKREKFIGVFGNSDPKSVRNQLASKIILELNDKKIGMTHPPQGGSSNWTLDRAFDMFKETKLDILLFGHTHSPLIKKYGKITILNPGKGYLEKSYFGPGTSYIILTIADQINAELFFVEN